MATIDNEPRPDSFVFYRSFFDAIEHASDNEQLQLYRGIAIYALNGTEPEFQGLLQAVWLVIRPQIEANRRRYLNGCKGAEHGKKGGRPKQPQHSECKTPAKPQVNPTLTPNVNDNENYNYNDNDNDNEDVVKNTRKAKRTSRFVAPSLQEIKDYILNNSLSVDAERFLNYYTANGWQVGRNKMKDWKAALRNWDRSEYNRPGTTQPNAINTAPPTESDTTTENDFSERF